MATSEDGKSQRGFAALTVERRREISQMGGKAVPGEKRSFSQNRALASAAGKKGGASLSPAERHFSKDRVLASAAGRKGGENHSARKRDIPTV